MRLESIQDAVICIVTIAPPSAPPSPTPLHFTSFPRHRQAYGRTRGGEVLFLASDADLRKMRQYARQGRLDFCKLHAISLLEHSMTTLGLLVNIPRLPLCSFLPSVFHVYTRTLHRVSTQIPARFLPPHLDNVEDVEAYRSGGYHPISIGDCFEQDRYKVLHKLGYGGSSTVWLARDQGGTKPSRLVALKALRADASSESNPALSILPVIHATNPPCTGVQTVDHHFTVKGPNGSHRFLVSPFAGPSILAMSDCPGRVAGSRRLRGDLARKVAKQIVTAVDCMHRAGVVHGGRNYAVVSLDRTMMDHV